MKKIIIKNKYKYNFPNLLYLVSRYHIQPNPALSICSVIAKPVSRS